MKARITIAEGQILHADRAEWRGRKVGYICNICGYWFERKELYDHPEMGFICYPDKARFEREEKAEERFEWEMDQAAKGDQQ